MPTPRTLGPSRIPARLSPGPGPGPRRTPAGAVRVEYAFAHMKIGKILRGCRQKGDDLQHALQAVATMHSRRSVQDRIPAEGMEVWASPPPAPWHTYAATAPAPATGVASAGHPRRLGRRPPRRPHAR
ncbi:hypothetical protein OG207_37215 [Streptomyces sp. NBC_01439]|nr:hypothetical protein [Streptomyces sp. NBC_01439]